MLAALAEKAVLPLDMHAEMPTYIHVLHAWCFNPAIVLFELGFLKDQKPFDLVYRAPWGLAVTSVGLRMFSAAGKGALECHVYSIICGKNGTRLKNRAFNCSLSSSEC